MTLSRFAVGLLLIPFVNADWGLPCAKPVLDARVDPILTPGKPSSYANSIMGSGAIGYSTTFDDLRNSQCSTCSVKDDKSAYWIPELYYQYKNGSFEAVTHGGINIHYLQHRAENETLKAFPDGLRILAGDPYTRSDTNDPASQIVSWFCLDGSRLQIPATPGFNNVDCQDGLRAHVFFPGCWDGVNPDSADHKSHMAYTDDILHPCPASHPVHLISIAYAVIFNVKPFNALNDGGRFVLANGDPTGYGMYGEFINGWDSSVLSRAVSNCTASEGVLEECSVFENEGRIASDAEMKACLATNSPKEQVGPGNLLPNLPGCVAVTDAPARATVTNQDLVVGCVAN